MKTLTAKLQLSNQITLTKRQTVKRTLININIDDSSEPTQYFCSTVVVQFFFYMSSRRLI